MLRKPPLNLLHYTVVNRIDWLYKRVGNKNCVYCATKKPQTRTKLTTLYNNKNDLKETKSVSRALYSTAGHGISNNWNCCTKTTDNPVWSGKLRLGSSLTGCCTSTQVHSQYVSIYTPRPGEGGCGGGWGRRWPRNKMYFIGSILSGDWTRRWRWWRLLLSV